jgi:hypothetical protein
MAPFSSRRDQDCRTRVEADPDRGSRLVMEQVLKLT